MNYLGPSVAVQAKKPCGPTGATITAQVKNGRLLVIRGIESTIFSAPSQSFGGPDLHASLVHDQHAELDDTQGPQLIDDTIATSSHVYPLMEEDRLHHLNGAHLAPDGRFIGLVSEHKRLPDDSIDDTLPSKRQRLWVADEYDDLSAQHSPRVTSFDSSQDATVGYSLRQRPVEHEPTASERREARMSRRNQNDTSWLAQTESEVDDAEDASDDGHESNYDIQATIGTNTSSLTPLHSKWYTDLHPEYEFEDVGDGRYQKILTSFDASKAEDRPATITIRGADRVNYPGWEGEFKWVGGDYWRRAITPPQATSSTGSVADHSDGLKVPRNDTFSKSEMLRHKQNNPDVTFVHRGNGRYKIVDPPESQTMETVVAGADDRVTYNKDYVSSHPESIFRHVGGGRYKKESRPTVSSQNSQESENSDSRIPTTMLFDRRYVEQHPELEFHHRGQGRYALGARREESSAGSDILVRSDKETLYDRAYVDKHPDDTFHHRGQGRWARGLPPPGSSSKMAVRGPGAKLVKSTSNSSSGTKDERPPEPGALYRKEEGPEKWPELEWMYRGGGKWRLKAQNLPRSRPAVLNKDVGEAIVQDESDENSDDDSDASTSQAESIDGQGTRRQQYRRTRVAVQSIEQDSPIRARHSRSPSPNLKLLSLEEDLLTDADLPELYLDEWSQVGPDDTDDEAAQLMRARYRPLNNPDLFLQSMLKHDPAVRPTETLYRLAEHMQDALRRMQDEYLQLDKITAPHARISRKVVTGGRIPVDPLVFEDRKEADLYDYAFDSKKIGFQDPITQRIIAEADGRGLRKRRKRADMITDAAAQLSEEGPRGRRMPKPVHRFDGNPGAQSRRPRHAMDRGSATPDVLVTPEKKMSASEAQAWAEGYVAPSSGRWANHIPKRIRELRGDSIGPSRNIDMEEEDEWMEGA